jgi:prepilin-type processing-associated H-X9-DG protein
MKPSCRQIAIAICLTGLPAAVVGWLSPSEPQPLSAAPVAVHPVDRVPADAQLFAHLEAANVWDHPAVLELRKSYAKELEEGLKTIEKETGLRPEQINSMTIHFPKLSFGNGDQQLFILQVTTKKPYDKDTVVRGIRQKGETAKDDVIKLQDKTLLHLTSDTQFTILHETLLDEFKKGPPKPADGLMSAAIKAAKTGKNTLVFGLDPSALPDEIFTNAPPELQPFLPLLKSKSIVLQANLDKELKAEIRFVADKEDQAIDSERSFNLLMKLADDALTTVLKNDKADETVKALHPALAELQKSVQATKAERQGTTITAKASLKADPALAKPILSFFFRSGGASARAQSSNNLKQIGLALHNYHDVNGVLPAAAIVDKKGKPLLSWRVAILPYIEQDNLYKQFKLDEPWDSEHNMKLAKIRVKTYELPYDPKPGITHYRAFVGNGAAFDMVQGIKFAQFTDGTSNTMMVFEGAEGVPWTKPDEIEFDTQKPMLPHLRFEGDRICNILMADGSVRAVPKTLAENVLKLLIQRDDGMPIPDFD